MNKVAEGAYRNHLQKLFQGHFYIAFHREDASEKWSYVWRPFTHQIFTVTWEATTENFTFAIRTTEIHIPLKSAYNNRN